jgi:hypothetical protein
MSTVQHYGSVGTAIRAVDVADDCASSSLVHSSDRGGAFTLVSVSPGRFLADPSAARRRVGAGGPALDSDIDYLTSIYGFSSFPMDVESLEIPHVAHASVTANPAGLTLSFARGPRLVAGLRGQVHPEWVQEAAGGSTVLGICVGVDLATEGVDGFFAALDANRAVLGEVRVRWTLSRSLGPRF